MAMKNDISLVNSGKNYLYKNMNLHILKQRHVDKPNGPYRHFSFDGNANT